MATHPRSLMALIVPTLTMKIELDNDTRHSMMVRARLNEAAFFTVKYFINGHYDTIHTSNLIDMVGSMPCWEHVRKMILTHPFVNGQVREYLRDHWSKMEPTSRAEPDVLSFLDA